MQGAFVRALGTVYHLNCFKCMVSLLSPHDLCLHHLHFMDRTVALLSHPSSFRSMDPTANNTRFARGTIFGVST